MTAGRVVMLAGEGGFCYEVLSGLRVCVGSGGMLKLNLESRWVFVIRKGLGRDGVGLLRSKMEIRCLITRQQWKQNSTIQSKSFGPFPAIIT
jgi:hypothetical protein